MLLSHGSSPSNSPPFDEPRKQTRNIAQFENIFFFSPGGRFDARPKPMLLVLVEGLTDWQLRELASGAVGLLSADTEDDASGLNRAISA